MCVVTTASVLVRRGANALPYLVESAVCLFVETFAKMLSCRSMEAII